MSILGNKNNQNIKKNIAILLAGHGVRGNAAAKALAYNTGFAKILSDNNEFDQIKWGYLIAKPSIHDVAADIDAYIIYIVPMLMCDGYLTKTFIPERLSLDGDVTINERGQKIIQCQPIGVNHLMAEVMIKHIYDHCDDNEITAEKTNIIIIGHGSSKGDASRNAISSQVEYIKKLNKFNKIHAAYLEEEPSLINMLQDINSKNTNTPILVMGYFAGHGNHSTSDVAELMRKSKVNATYLGPVGILPEIADVVLDCIKSSDLKSIF